MGGNPATGKNDSADTWALIVETSDLEHLHDVAISAWGIASESDPNDLKWQLLKRLRAVAGNEPKADVGS